MVSIVSPKLAMPLCLAWVVPTHGSSGTSLLLLRVWRWRVKLSLWPREPTLCPPRRQWSFPQAMSMGRTKEYLFYQRALKEISCQSSVEDSALSPLGAQIPSLVSELRSLMPHAVAKKKTTQPFRLRPPPTIQEHAAQPSAGQGGASPGTWWSGCSWYTCRVCEAASPPALRRGRQTARASCKGGEPRLRGRGRGRRRRGRG